MVRPDEEVVVDDAVEAWGVAGGHDFLVPDVQRVGGDRQTGLRAKLTAQGSQRVLAEFDAAAWSCPHGFRLARHRRVREDEPAEQDSIVLVQNDRAHGGTQVRRHGVSDAVAGRTVIGTAADYQPLACQRTRSRLHVYARSSTLDGLYDRHARTVRASCVRTRTRRCWTGPVEVLAQLDGVEATGSIRGPSSVEPPRVVATQVPA